MYMQLMVDGIEIDPKYLPILSELHLYSSRCPNVIYFNKKQLRVALQLQTENELFSNNNPISDALHRKKGQSLIDPNNQLTVR